MLPPLTLWMDHCKSVIDLGYMPEFCEIWMANWAFPLSNGDRLLSWPCECVGASIPPGKKAEIWRQKPCFSRLNVSEVRLWGTALWCCGVWWDRMLLQPINPSRRVSCLFMTRSLQVVIRAFTFSMFCLGLGWQALTGLCLSDSLHERIGVLPCSEPVCLSVSVLQALSGVIHLSGAVSAALCLHAWGFSLFCLSLPAFAVRF